MLSQNQVALERLDNAVSIMKNRVEFQIANGQDSDRMAQLTRALPVFLRERSAQVLAPMEN